jgi:hypothetical protein
MNHEQFSVFVEQVDWRFAKSIPNWPHFYIVEKEITDQKGFRAAKSFVLEEGRDGKFYNLDVRYYDVDGWTYWSSPLNSSLDEQYMLNRCKTEFTYDSLKASGSLPPEGFQEAALNLTPVLEDHEFQSLIRDTKGSVFTVFDVLGTADYEIRHSNVLYWLLDPSGNHGQGCMFLELIWEQFTAEMTLPKPNFADYSVDREGTNEEEKIDLLLRSKGSDWLIVIENKLFSPETGDQLDRYFHYVERRYSDVPARHYFYLTPDGIGPAREEDSANWIPVSYLGVKQAVSTFLGTPLPDRVGDFLKQYLEHIERNVLRSSSMTERQRNILKRHSKTFHSLTFLLEEESIRKKCDDIEFNLLKSILAVQQEVEAELFKFTKRMMAKHGYRRHSGLGHWVTIEIPGLREKLIVHGLLRDLRELPIVWVFVSAPHSFRVEVWIYKKMPLYSKTRGRLLRFSTEKPEPSRGDEHLVDVLFRKTIIHPDEIIRDSLPELKSKIEDYFEIQLHEDLSNAMQVIGEWADLNQVTE